MDIKDWFLIIGPLAGVLIGGLITTLAKLLELGHKRVYDDRRLMLEKLEQLHRSVGAFIAVFADYVRTNRLALSKEPGVAGQFVALALKDQSVLQSMTEISSSIGLYAPECRTFWALTLSLVNKYQRSFAEVEAKEKGLDQLEGFVGKVASSCELVKSSIEAKIEKLGLIVVHGKSSFSENLSLTFAKRFGDSMPDNEAKLEELDIISEELHERRANLEKALSE